MSSSFTSPEFLIPLVICLIISISILWFYRTKNPVKQFRPPWGELLIFGIVLFGASTSASYLVCKTITEGQDSIEEMKKIQKMGPGKGGGGAAGGGSETVFEETLRTIDEDRKKEESGER